VRCFTTGFELDGERDDVLKPFPALDDVFRVTDDGLTHNDELIEMTPGQTRTIRYESGEVENKLFGHEYIMMRLPDQEFECDVSAPGSR
jgi:hypothetical protein